MLLLSAALLFALPNPDLCLFTSNPGPWNDPWDGSLAVITGDCFFQYAGPPEFVGHTTECQALFGTYTCQEAVCDVNSPYCTWIPSF